MNKSFELLSSMSPNLKGRQKTLTKAKPIKVLALKKSFRRCSVYDKLDLNKKESAITNVNTKSSCNEKNNFNTKWCELYQNDIVVIESTDDEDLPIQSGAKINIQKWIDNTDVPTVDKSETFFSQLSSICGEDALECREEVAISSTCHESFTKRLDEMFMHEKKGLPKSDNKNIESFDCNEICKNKEKELNTPIGTKAEIVSEKIEQSDDSIIVTDDNKTPDKSLKNQKSFKNERGTTEDPQEDTKAMETLLDSLYGTKWRDRQFHVLPNSEPRKKPEPTRSLKTTIPKTEKKVKWPNNGEFDVKPSLTRKKLNFDKLKKPSVSPWRERLKALCSSDSDSDSEITSENSQIKSKRRQHITMNENKENMTPRNKKNTKKDLIDKNREIMHNVYDTEKSLLKHSNFHSEDRSQKNSSSSASYSSGIEISSDEEYDKEVTKLFEEKKKNLKPLKETSYSFLESLSAHIPINKCNISARIFRSCFNTYKEELVKKLFSLYNDKVFEGKIPSNTEIQWNVKLRNTAGLCYCMRTCHRNGEEERKVRISLSSKVVDSPDRLRDTLIHEMCHAATWIVNKVSNGHGAFWKNWAFKAMTTFPELPPISRCHSYTINTKYTYQCINCGYSIGRHTKSLNVERKRCGYCFGKFEVFLNKTSKNGQNKAVPINLKKEPTGFALFVKQNYATYKEPTRKHADIMKILSQKFAEIKIKNTV